MKEGRKMNEWLACAAAVAVTSLASAASAQEVVPAEPLPDSWAYEDGDYVPPGYRVEASPRWGLVTAGATTLGLAWAINVAVAIKLDHAPDGSGDPNFDDMYWPMFIPVVGPALAIPTSDASGTGAAILGLDSAVQAGALAMFIAGFAFPELEVVKRKTPVWVEPTASRDGSGLTLSGSF
jgi:hypothetical protein